MFCFAHFLQECPVCGRPLRVRVEHTGRLVCCEHCGGQFVASQPRRWRERPEVEKPMILRRAEQLLRLSQRRLHPSVAAGWVS